MGQNVCQNPVCLERYMSQPEGVSRHRWRTVLKGSAWGLRSPTYLLRRPAAAALIVGLARGEAIDKAIYARRQMFDLISLICAFLPARVAMSPAISDHNVFKRAALLVGYGGVSGGVLKIERDRRER